MGVAGAATLEVPRPDAEAAAVRERGGVEGVVDVAWSDGGDGGVGRLGEEVVDDVLGLGFEDGAGREDEDAAGSERGPRRSEERALRPSQVP